MDLIETITSTFSFLATILGSLLLIALLLSIVIIVIVLILLAYSFKTGNFLFPNVMIISLVFFEGPIRAVLRLLRIDDSRMDRISIYLRNKAMCPTFRKIPYTERAIFIPQCVRSINCPARLSPEGIKCKDCGQCRVSEARKFAEGLGYKFFIVPGSSFIIRMIKQYQPKAIIGVGCLCEVKEGLDLMHKYKIPSIGVMLDHSGCVATTLNWDKLFDVMKVSENKVGIMSSIGSNMPMEDSICNTCGEGCRKIP
ncbi:hypothetical protein CUJ83_11595 [Methanocella sp. CWC-04]|uniref:DUF116 domain-containing protein n=1 Tax=Methanooceanicella nereidis TaxID=2052831 RepID=A0AAP2RF11_9EURY|nr:DUF116 domain-containing protein [Methanocella sp. CWC-04]MCD1295641.1 hypothetical protein [Methanocella sp. CWC-04]